MNERIGTFCEKCREVVCRCAEYKKILNECFKETYKKTLDKTRISSISLDSEPYGWVIEQNSTGKYSTDAGKTYKYAPWSGWIPTCKHKTYKTREIAVKAVESMRKSDGMFKVSYRILPVYSGEPEVLDDNLNLPLKIEQ